MPTGWYVPGTSVLHRAPPGVKLAALAGLGSLLLALRQPWLLAVGVAAVAAGFLAAGLGWRTAVRQVWPLRWVVLVLVPFQAVTAGWSTAVEVVGTLLVMVAAAGLVTATTRVTDMLATVVRLLGPARRLGVDPDRVGLLLALTLRAVPVMATLAHETADARRARGLERSARALVVPLAVRTVRHADRLGDALAARGVGD